MDDHIAGVAPGRPLPVSAIASATAITALIHNRAEVALFQEVGKQLNLWLTDPADAAAPVGMVIAPLAAPRIENRGPVVMTLRADVARAGEPIAGIAARWRQRVDSLRREHDRPLFLCTLFRHVAAPADAPDHTAVSWARAHIRRLDLMAAELSRATGINIIDIDRVFAFFGARAMETDYRLGGEKATRAAADIIVCALLEAGLDDCLAEPRLEAARARHGGYQKMGARLKRMLAAPSPPGTTDVAA